MTTTQMYVKTGAGREIARIEIDDCIISIQTSSGKELARMKGSDFALHRAIARFHAELTECYGSFLSASAITEITADTFGVHPSHVRRSVSRNYKTERGGSHAA